MPATFQPKRTVRGPKRWRPRLTGSGARKALSFTVMVGIMLSLSACFQHTFTIGSGAPDGDQVYKAWHHHWIFGLIRPEHQEELIVAKLCPSGNATIHKETTFLNGLIDVLIGIIYSPSTVTITCDDGSESSVELGPEEVSEIVTDPLFMEVVEELVPERLAEARTALDGTTGGLAGSTLAVTR